MEITENERNYIKEAFKRNTAPISANDYAELKEYKKHLTRNEKREMKEVLNDIDNIQNWKDEKLSEVLEGNLDGMYLFDYDTYSDEDLAELGFCDEFISLWNKINELE